MGVLVDDIGSFPLPSDVDRRLFNKAYILAREAIINGKNVKDDDFLVSNFYRVIADSFRKKLNTGLDVVNYPQHYGIHEQFTEAIHGAMSKGTYAVEERDAIIPEVSVIKEEAKRLCEETGKKILLRVCVTGPMELYLKEVGTTPYLDILMMFAETTRRFAENAVLDSKYVKTEVVSIDEPSFGLRDISADKDVLLDVIKKTFDFSGAIKQIHLHSSSRVADTLEIRNLDVLSFEYASSPKNIEAVSRKTLEGADKRIRVGITRTDVDSITAELYQQGTTRPAPEQLVEDEETIRRRFEKAKEKFGDRMTFTGPDCGLGGWPTQEAAQLLLRRTVDAVKSVKTSL
jgi:5-methyltetrahydropteroyltriglutamate--homocysteine methyltransferase